MSGRTAVPLLLAVLALSSLVGSAVGDETQAPGRRLLLGLTGEGKLDALRPRRAVLVEFGLEQGAQRVPASIRKIESTSAGTRVEVELARAMSGDEGAPVRGLLLRDDRSRGGARVGLAIGSVLGFWLSDRLIRDETSAWKRRGTQISAGIACGYLAGIGGRLLGSAWSTPRGYPVSWAHPVE